MLFHRRSDALRRHPSRKASLEPTSHYNPPPIGEGAMKVHSMPRSRLLKVILPEELNMSSPSHWFPCRVLIAKCLLSFHTFINFLCHYFLFSCCKFFTFFFPFPQPLLPMLRLPLPAIRPLWSIKTMFYSHYHPINFFFPFTGIALTVLSFSFNFFFSLCFSAFIRVI